MRKYPRVEKMEGFSNSNQDFLTEYRAISGKLKKRFLRSKPNVSEASQQFAKLAKKVKTSEEPQYEGTLYKLMVCAKIPRIPF